jgi:signal transduction histidine kinase
LVVGLGGALGVSVLLGVPLTRAALRPLDRLVETTERIATDDLSARSELPHGDDEIGRLAASFDQMLERIEAGIQNQRRFVADAAHELRTPLTAIKGHVDALRDGLVDDPELVGASLDVVANEATRLERLVGDVLDLAKLRAHRFTVHTEEVDMGRLVEHAYGSFGDEARRREIAYTLGGSDTAPTIITDGDRVLQVITNLLKNAFRWTPDGGSIGVELDASNGVVRVDVSDTGPGIAPEDAQRIFSPFVSHDTQGTGLGLPIAQELAGALGGRIELATEPGKGSRFRLVLPARNV